jgi:hypothetical protein
MASPEIKLEVIPTPNPDEFSVRVWQDANQMKLDFTPTLGELYKNSAIPTLPRRQDFANYIYCDSSKDKDDIWFYYAKPKTPEQRQTPFRTSFATRQYPWPGVLYSLDIYQTSTFPQTVYNGSTTQTAPRYFAKYVYKPTPNVSSVVKIEEYLSDKPFSQSEITHVQPIPTDINGDFLGKEINFPRCLHPKVVFDNNIPGAQKVFGQGTVDETGNWNPNKQIFPATNFLDWAPFVIEDDVDLVNGQYYRRKATIFPPVSPKRVIQ